jgi:hypothetical protein
MPAEITLPFGTLVALVASLVLAWSGVVILYAAICYYAPHGPFRPVSKSRETDPDYVEVPRG